MQPMLQCSDGSSPTVTARCSNAGIVNMLDLAHYPIQGVLVQDIMSDGIIMIGNIYYGKYRHGFAGNVVGVTGISPTITCVGGGGNRMPLMLIENEREKYGRQEYENLASK